MTRIFRKRPIGDYFREVAISIKKEIDGYTNDYIGKVNIEIDTARLIKKYAIVLPRLVKERTQSAIIAEKVSGYNLPAGTPFVPGQIYEIEIANYQIPFIGDKHVLECMPTRYSGWTENVEVSNQILLFQITNWGKITGDEKSIEIIKNLLLLWVDKIEETLNAAKADIEKFHSEIEVEIRSHLELRIKSLKTKTDSADKLNPFK